MSGYSKLWSEIVTSSIWSQDDKTRIVWVTILALKDQHGYIPASIPGLANASRVSVEDCEKAIAILESPDKYSRSTEHEGRRIEKVDGGWLVLNHHKYRDKKGIASDPTAAERQARYRERHNSNGKVTESNGSVTDSNAVTPLRNVTPVSVSVSCIGIEEKRVQGEEKKSGGSLYPDDFETFWSAYPKKKSKKDALRAWKKATDKPELHVILSKLAVQANSQDWKKEGGQFIPYPATWLNEGKWDDEEQKNVLPSVPKNNSVQCVSTFTCPRCGKKGTYEDTIPASLGGYDSPETEGKLCCNCYLDPNAKTVNVVSGAYTFAQIVELE